MGLFTGREVSDPKPRSRTLMDAVRDDDRALIAETLARGESVTQTNAYGRTPLHKACYYSGAPAVIEELIRLGADVDAVDKGNWTCAHLAARNHHNDALAVLLSIGDNARDARRVNLAIADVKHGWTAAHSAASATASRVAWIRCPPRSSASSGPAKPVRTLQLAKSPSEKARGAGGWPQLQLPAERSSSAACAERAASSGWMVEAVAGVVATIATRPGRYRMAARTAGAAAKSISLCELRVQIVCARASSSHRQVRSRAPPL